MAAGSLERHPYRLLPSAPRDDVAAIAGAVHRDEHLDPVFVWSLLKQVPHAAKIARAFFADVSDEKNVAASSESSHRPSRRIIASNTARERESSPMPGAISRVPSRLHLHVVPSGNTVSRCAAIAISGPFADAFANSHRIAFRVDFNVGQAMLPEHLQIGAGPIRFLERRRLDFGERDDFTDDPVVVLVDELLAPL